MTPFGSEPYSFEELVAEIGACYLQSVSGIAPTQFDNNVAYIKGWLDTLEKDRRFIFLASSQAQKATDFILNLKKEEKPEEEVFEGVKEVDDLPV